MTLRERIEQLFHKKQEEPIIQERRKIEPLKTEPLKPIYADKPSVVSSHISSRSSTPSFDTSSVKFDNWKIAASRELPNSEYYLQHFSPEQLKELVIANRRGHDISVFADPEQTPEQLRFIYTHAEFGEDVSAYLHNTEFDPARIEKKESAQFLMGVVESNQERKKLKKDLAELTKDPLYLKNIENQTFEICLCAVHNNGMALEFAQHQTPQICAEAIRNNPKAIQFAKNQTEDLCMQAVKQDGMALKHVRQPSLEVCKEAVRRNPHAVKFVPDQFKGQFADTIAKSTAMTQKLSGITKKNNFEQGR